MVSDVLQTLRARDAHFTVVHHAPATDRIQESIALGMPPADVLKTVVLETDHRVALAVLPAIRRLDMSLVREVLHDPHARLATESEIERELPEWELGAVPPLGSVVHAPVYVDPEVMGHPVIVFAAGTQTESVTGPTAEIFLHEQVTVAPIAAHYDGPTVETWIRG